MSDICDEVKCSPSNELVPKQCTNADWRKMYEYEKERSDNLMETCDKFYHENQILKSMFAEEYEQHRLDKQILKETRSCANSAERRLYQLKNLFEERGDSMRIPKEIKAEILDLLRF